jgi:hypothetical protein
MGSHDRLDKIAYSSADEALDVDHDEVLGDHLSDALVDQVVPEVQTGQPWRSGAGDGMAIRGFSTGCRTAPIH